ncbi:hypothetical protein DPMN_021664 [Dreissena polymorpha]|uniref:Uncharacterized protein n=1 Tax=Dreissena polymorpha TaxID=45954 RepID=A0A9D4NN60_DREPO|nr:hypothetical protein DPMN_021664 [Dreissena polymorpha]
MDGHMRLLEDQQTNNWVKACIALAIAKDGLVCFVETEIKKVHGAVGKSCGTCNMANVLQCPTQGICKARKKNKCSFHKPPQCKICEQEKAAIISVHRFCGPSWRNTKAER